MIIKRMLFGLLAFMTLAPLSAYKTKHKDQKYDKNNPPDSIFRVDGVIFAGYEFLDHDEAGEVESAGPSKESSGFKVGRAYINFRGKVDDGDWKGWGFRITTDIAPLGGEIDSSSTTTISDNDYNVNLKYAIVHIPTPIKGLNFLLGQQHVPFVDGKGGVSLQGYWGHRYVDKATTEFLGMSSSTDRGLGLTYYNKDMPFFGLHLLYANGEGYHHNNAEGVKTEQTSLSDLSEGKNSSKSYGMDLYGMPSLIPTGANKDIRVAISFPFRLQNIHGMDVEKETKTILANVEENTTPSLVVYQGDARSKRDYSYGSEVDLEITAGDLKYGMGAGGIIKIDKRGNAYKFDETFHEIVSPSKPTEFTDRVHLGQDQKGIAQYIFAHIRYQDFGIFGRYTIATSSSSLSSKFGTSNSKSWGQQLIEADSTDDKIGNLKYLDAINNYDSGKAKTKTYHLGITWFMSPVFKISLGMNDVWGDNPASGKHFKSTPLDRIKNASGTTVTKQLESNGALKNEFGGTMVEVDDFNAKAEHDKQVWIRTEFKY